MMPPINLKVFLNEFNRSQVAQFVTNSNGFILEVNQASADLLKSNIPHLKHKKLTMFIADRKNSQKRYEDGRHVLLTEDCFDEKNIIMRTQSSVKKEMIRTNVSGQVITRSATINLILLTVVDADLIRQETSEAERICG